ncbi:uncharacterized protein L969DRAFT_48479 [Mixia osmundae IAM 14324]|uniref:uncharacterized protein n=1 Tax=Mixia osmundae (strain CBS 9802 / IAM 14324 / JCM 22182 / KY 12970) TaxID=764103 RepID=UPI0004A54C78|nr:uncharacterized protein L969DRAFT_48479 [Mixia osmundae IAM 14324]KEI39683.1 hypothetical protein L969DRAFT_48479 [Mixia osmundae IAM 14324]
MDGMNLLARTHACIAPIATIGKVNIYCPSAFEGGEKVSAKLKSFGIMSISTCKHLSSLPDFTIECDYTRLTDIPLMLCNARDPDAEVVHCGNGYMARCCRVSPT